jgi:hypothetical protein
MDFDHGGTVVLEVHDLSASELCADDEQEREGEKDNRAPVQNPGEA